MRGDDLDDLLLDQRLLEERGGGEVPRLAVGLRERLVGDLAQQVLEEAVLAVLGRARVGLDAEDLLAGERGEDRLELGLGAAPQRRERLLRERLAEHGRVLDDAALGRREPVEPRRDQRVQRLGHLERLDRPGRPVDGPLLDERARSSSMRTVSTA